MTGAYEPSGAEVEYPSDKEDEEEDGEVNCASHLTDFISERMFEASFQVVLAKKVEDLSLNPDFPADAKGIPKFWLHVLKNGNEEALMGLVEEHDEEVLENLTNITVALDTDNAGFTLTFHFQENAFFTNQVWLMDQQLIKNERRSGPSSKFLTTNFKV